MVAFAPIATRRLPNVQRLLVDWATPLRHQPYEWGKTDCASLLRAALSVMYGADVLPTLPHWKSASGALRLFHRCGGIISPLTALGGREVPPAFYRAGDVFVIAHGERLPGIWISLGLKFVGSLEISGVCLADFPTLKKYNPICMRLP